MPLVSLRAELKKAGSSPQNENLYQPEILVFLPLGIPKADFSFILGLCQQRRLAHPLFIFLSSKCIQKEKLR